mgnify:CR=1 FL=1
MMDNFTTMKQMRTCTEDELGKAHVHCCRTCHEDWCCSASPCDVPGLVDECPNCVEAP